MTFHAHTSERNNKKTEIKKPKSVEKYSRQKANPLSPLQSS
jgi:hypothetical protein